MRCLIFSSILLLLGLPAAAQTTWNSSDKSTKITLSGSNLTATANTSTAGGVRSTTATYTGKVYFEVTVNGVSDSFGIGLATAEWPLDGLGSQGNSIEWLNCRNGGNYRRLGPDAGPCLASGPATSDILQVAVDLTHNLIWMRKTSESAGVWNGITANPATGSGGTNLQVGGGSVPLFIAFIGDVFTGTSGVTLNVGGSAFTGSVPSGFTAWGAGGAAIPGGQTIWNASDKSSLVSVLDSGLRAEATPAGSQGGVRATTSYRAGKVYWEIPRFNIGTLDWIGIADANQSLTSLANPPAGSDYVLCGGGTVTYNGGSVGSCPSANTGDTSFIALDVTGGLIWFSSSAAGGAWNGGGGADPATGTGGITIHIHGTPTTCIYPLFYGDFANAGTQPVQYINTGGTIAFRGSIPSGFIGWQSGVSGPCNGGGTQLQFQTPW